MKKWLPLFLGINCLSHTIDNAHFYRATNLFLEPRLEKKHLSSFELDLAIGSNCESKNKKRYTVPLLDIYGTHNMHELGVGVPNKDLTKTEDIILEELARIPGQGSNVPTCNCATPAAFAHFSIGGKFKIYEANLLYIQNITKGFFAQAHLPIRRLEIKEICFKDISPTNCCPNNEEPVWLAFKNQFDAILSRYNLSKKPLCKTGIGDLSILAGWTLNHQDTEVLDFIDLTIRAGILIPTGKKSNVDHLFSLPLGYDGHLGFPLSIDIALGLYEWLTLAAHLDGTLFIDDTRDIRIKTALHQSGLIKLAKSRAKIDKGTLWTAGLLLKADHVYSGLSFLFGYSFANKGNDQLRLCDECFNESIANSDEILKSWKMHTIHFFAEYDFTQEDSRLGARVAFFYNRTVGGKRIFKTNMIGGTLGFDINWDF